jgi:hypothetical protein
MDVKHLTIDVNVIETQIANFSPTDTGTEAIRVYRQEERRDKADRKQLAASRRRLFKASLNG